eukprot:366095-Chlamydomonas_euryale.AAC.12
MDQTGSARSYPTSTTARCGKERKAQRPEKEKQVLMAVCSAVVRGGRHGEARAVQRCRVYNWQLMDGRRSCDNWSGAASGRVYGQLPGPNKVWEKLLGSFCENLPG